MPIARQAPTEPVREENVVPLPGRSERFLELVDEALCGLGTDRERRIFLEQQIAGWEQRYARFLCSQGQSEPSYLADDPPHCSDFLLTITGLASRLEQLPRPRRKRCADCGKYWADPPSDLCPGCEAYREHQA